jgi:hypothetical protein
LKQPKRAFGLTPWETTAGQKLYNKVREVNILAGSGGYLFFAEREAATFGCNSLLIRFTCTVSQEDLYDGPVMHTAIWKNSLVMSPSTFLPIGLFPQNRSRGGKDDSINLMFMDPCIKLYRNNQQYATV